MDYGTLSFLVAAVMGFIIGAAAVKENPKDQKNMAIMATFCGFLVLLSQMFFAGAIMFFTLAFGVFVDPFGE